MAIRQSDFCLKVALLAIHTSLRLLKHLGPADAEASREVLQLIPFRFATLSLPKKKVSQKT
jgi:hypothetical protein